MAIFTSSRRHFVGGLVAAPFILPAAGRAQLPFADYPFTLGVAAGDAQADGFVIWTRLAPDPLDPHGGMPMAEVPVDWEVAEDEHFRTIAAKGTEKAWPELAHSVHVEVTGLKPGRPYWYRFRCAGERTFAGRATTLPAPGSRVDRVRFAAIGCQHFEAGYYTAYRHAAEDAPDFMFHYGDYIYEYSPGFVLDAFDRPIEAVRRYATREPFSLDDYRVRYAQTTTDADLQAARAAAPWYCTYDDHEVQNNWVSEWAQDGTPPETFLLRRRAAFQAWYEHMPVRRSSFPDAQGVAHMRRRVDIGDLIRLHMPNTRLYRSDQPCGDGFKPLCAEASAATQQVLGKAQESWLEEGFTSSSQHWQGVAQQVMMAPIDRRTPDYPNAQPTYNMDSWAAYPGPRERILALFDRHKGGNVVVVTGDEHQNWAIDLQRDGRTVASEFVSTSITSGGDGHDLRPGNEEIMRDNPFLHWTNDRRGYLLSDITRDAWTGHFRVVDAITRRDAPIATAARWAVQSGQAGLVSA
ncbi:alkaline phosphatase D family protein [Stakelama sp. CBK3Z-3]|uniref:Alkaline phosphatase D family protein n=1 Tax=Stakelama flava TaxID=2860338 RepID=A0ABS6XN12_9SPHN|nr:alkaline phosphatase D family protein [Stakelama flava]MBW4331168.1 alkaline phosphatase D family protein [Stakelama flava]